MDYGISASGRKYNAILLIRRENLTYIIAIIII